MRILLSLLLFFTVSQKLLAWGNNGHRIIAKIAYDHLSQDSRAKLKQVLKSELLEEVANWPDFMRSAPNYSHTFPWHYINVPEKKSKNRKSKKPKENILTAIAKFKKQLKSPSSTLKQKRDATAWLAHLVGDLHQPLHSGKASDKGGNKVRLTWFGKRTNLHVIWDTLLIEMQNLSYSEYVRFIDHPTKDEIKAWQKSAPTDWIEENSKLMKLVYSYPKKNKKRKKYWEYNYAFATRAAMNKRLVQAGYRLAYMLEQSL